MRTKVIPAQITTVEDKIAGNLNLAQILILMVPVFWTTIVYTLFPPTLHIAWYKAVLIILILFVSLGLALRIKGKVILNWLIILLQYTARPKYYLFNKNDGYLRTMDLPVFEKNQRTLFKKVLKKQKARVKIPGIKVSDLVRLEGLLADPRYSFSLKSKKKGTLYVAFEQVQK